jgi:hypothetical protein
MCFAIEILAQLQQAKDTRCFTKRTVRPTLSWKQSYFHRPGAFLVRSCSFTALPQVNIMDRRGGGGGGGRKTLLAPIHFIFKLLQQRSTVSIWLYEQTAVRIEGKIRVCAALAVVVRVSKANFSRASMNL